MFKGLMVILATTDAINGGDTGDRTWNLGVMKPAF